MIRLVHLMTILSLTVFFISCGDDDGFINTEPQISDQSFNVDENSPNGTIVGTVESFDTDMNQTLSFSIISGNTDDAFEINNAGELSVANESALDFEETSSFQLNVQVNDDYEISASSQAIITLTLNNITITTSGLIAYYSLNGNANDESVNSNHGIVQGPTPTEDRNGNPSSAYSFDGVDDYIELGNSDVFSLGNYSNFTVSFWVKPSASSNGTTTSIFSKYIAASDNRYYSFLYRPTDNLAFTIYENGGTTLERSESSIPDTEWYNVTWVYSNGSCGMFNNGVSVGTTVFTIPIITGPTTANAVIGAFHQFTSLYTGNFTGIIDELRIYDRSLTSNEVEILFIEPN